MATLYSVAVRIGCGGCGKAMAMGWARRPTAFACPGCGAVVAPDDGWLRGEIERVEREWVRLGENLRRQGGQYC